MSELEDPIFTRRMESKGSVTLMTTLDNADQFERHKKKKKKNFVLVNIYSDSPHLKNGISY